MVTVSKNMKFQDQFQVEVCQRTSQMASACMHARLCITQNSINKSMQLMQDCAQAMHLYIKLILPNFSGFATLCLSL